MKKYLLIFLAALVLTGCSDIDIPSEQHAQIVEYSAGLLLKYDRYYENNLINITLPEPEPEVTAEAVSEEVLEDTENETEGGGNIPEIIDNSSNLPRDMTEIVDIPGLEFHYLGTIITNSYPDEVVPGEIYFVVDASPGFNLMVVRFNVVNTTAEDIFLDMNAMNLRIAIGYNGESLSGAMFTMLLNDLSFFQGDIPAGGVVELYSMCETTLSDAAEIRSIEYFVRTANGDVTIVW
ncbi:MAG: lipoprotein [Lachnospiraceae bacterium]|nr:lipoprotein [Lachnospiraceae bacterium]